MAHLALYRAYRPQNFDSVVGQKHIVQTIKNQVKNDLLAHAYMLTGPRGTGKTSIARIVAKAVNCENADHGNPCSTCESCLAIANGNHPDVFELDGASNNGVDEIRDIRERVKYAPSLSTYKVYIIDEVHMLSMGAFNALLKTLEEPPAHVIFMLATTEIHKVPETILSRTQRFDLLQIPTVAMTDHLKNILDTLDIPFEDGAPELVSTLAAGGLRDALSMLDQAIAYKTDIITLSDIHDLNGSVTTVGLVELMHHIIAGNFGEIVATTRTLLAAGKLPARIIDGLLGLLRDVLKVQKLGGIDETDLAKKLTSQQILTHIKALNALTHELKIAADGELMLEVGLLEVAFEKNEPTPPQPIKTTNNSVPTDDAKIHHLTEQIRKLQAEMDKLRLAQPPGTSERPAENASVSMDFPVFVQGELVNKEQMPATEKESLKETIHGQMDDLEALQGESLGEVVASEGLLIETILAHATVGDKSNLQQKLAAANPFAKLAIKEIVMLLKDAEVVAASSVGCILVYEYETTVQKVLLGENRQKAHDVLSDIVGRAYEFLALPKSFWSEQREQYVRQNKQGPLKQYAQSVTESVAEAPISAVEVPIYQEVVDLFGEMVEVIE